MKRRWDEDELREQRKVRIAGVLPRPGPE